MQPDRTKQLFKPDSVALFGASTVEGALGTVILQNLKSAGFHGEITLVNPKYEEIDGDACFPSLAASGREVDLAVIVAPAKVVPSFCSMMAHARRVFSDDVDVHAGHAAAPGACDDQVGEGQPRAAQDVAHALGVGARVEQRADGHVAGHAADEVEMQVTAHAVESLGVSLRVGAVASDCTTADVRSPSR